MARSREVIVPRARRYEAVTEIWKSLRSLAGQVKRGFIGEWTVTIILLAVRDVGLDASRHVDGIRLGGGFAVQDEPFVLEAQ